MVQFTSIQLAKKLCFCALIGVLLLFSTINIIKSYPGRIPYSVQQEGPEEGVANTNVNVTLNSDETTYQRNTFLPKAEDIGIEILHYSAIAKLTTHGDLYFEIIAEFSTDNDTSWQSNYTDFKNSPEVRHFRDLYALQDIVPVNISLLENTTSSFSTWEEPEHPEFGRLFGIEQRVVLRQTTVFLLSLPEPFQFDRNKLELSQLSDFHFESVYHYDKERDEREIFELVRIKAPGSVLEYLPAVKGYSGIIYMTGWEPEAVPRFQRQFADARQHITLKIKLPIQQDVDFSFDSQYTKNPLTTKNGNIVTFEFPPDGKIPYYVKIDSQIPFLEQFTITDYVGMAFGALAALVTSVKGIPYFWNRRSYNKYIKGLRSAVDKGNMSEFKLLQEKAVDKYVGGKFSTNQFEEVRKEIQMLKRLKETTPKEETKSPLEELLGT
ncbi:MAG: hypothetical protein JSW11_17390 [Candidatus Heimdallarchaeota archaeon]|nr:MAG: hypothetical protein JSW11_17390 [Candidatus Heimdallarchaeota archaeon]